VPGRPEQSWPDVERTTMFENSKALNGFSVDNVPTARQF
jgi:hypothetical protein